MFHYHCLAHWFWSEVENAQKFTSQDDHYTQQQQTTITTGDLEPLTQVTLKGKCSYLFLNSNTYKELL